MTDFKMAPMSVNPFWGPNAKALIQVKRRGRPSAAPASGGVLLRSVLLTWRCPSGPSFVCSCVCLPCQSGAQLTDCILEPRGQWWRLISSQFLHAGFLHVLSNMLALASLGPKVRDPPFPTHTNGAARRRGDRWNGSLAGRWWAPSTCCPASAPR
jgi:hypothetical protein